MSLEKRISELETIVSEKSSKLETYERLESELDDVVMQAAESESQGGAKGAKIYNTYHVSGVSRAYFNERNKIFCFACIH